MSHGGSSLSLIRRSSNRPAVFLSPRAGVVAAVSGPMLQMRRLLFENRGASRAPFPRRPSIWRVTLCSLRWRWPVWMPSRLGLPAAADEIPPFEYALNRTNRTRKRPLCYSFCAAALTRPTARPTAVAVAASCTSAKSVLWFRSGLSTTCIEGG